MRRVTSLSLLAVLFVVAVLISSCGGGSSSTPAAATYSISGTVTSGAAGLAGVTVALSGAKSATATTNANGNYSFTGLANGSYTVTPSKSGYTFTPTSSAKSVSSANVTGADFAGTSAYATADLAGTWYSLGLKTPVKSTSNAANFGYDVDQAVVSSNGVFTSTTISSSDSASIDTATLSINADGQVSVVGDPDLHYMYLSASKDVMIELWKNDVVGEQQLWANVKKASTYTTADLAGTWYGIGLKTPMKNTSNSANFGYDVDQLTISSNGTFTSTTISTSDSSSTDTATLTIDNNGLVSVIGDPDPHYIYLNANKDVLVELWKNDATEEEQLWISVKKASAYTLADLAGTWYGVGLKTPVKNTSNPANFGYDVDRLVINSNGTFTSTTISTSDSSSTGTATLSIDSNGLVSVAGDPDPHYIYLNASKDVMIELWKDDVTGEQQLWISVKTAQ